MKIITIKIITIFVLALASTSHLVYAQDINDTYSRNTTLTVGIMDNIKKAVNSKQDSVNGEKCGTQEAIQSIATNGTVECINVPTSSTGSLTGAVSVHGAQFNLTDEYNVEHKRRLIGLKNTGATTFSSETIEALANISLPHGTTAKSIRCSVNNNTGNNFSIKLRGVKIDDIGSAKQEIFNTNLTTNTGTVAQILSDTTTTDGVIDNINKVYAIFMDLPLGASIHGCSVRY